MNKSYGAMQRAPPKILQASLFMQHRQTPLHSKSQPVPSLVQQHVAQNFVHSNLSKHLQALQPYFYLKFMNKKLVLINFVRAKETGKA